MNILKKTLNITPEIFRAYDIRGIVEEQLTESTVMQLGQAIGSSVLQNGETIIIVGRDGRLSGPSLSKTLIAGLRHTGCAVIDVGMVPTPVLYFATRHLKIPSAIMITGSHNPAHYNGFKIVLGGRALHGPDILEIYQLMLKQCFHRGEGSYQHYAILDPYINWLKKQFILLNPLKIVVDAGNGVTGLILEALYQSLGCTVIPLFCEVDGHFPNHHPDPGQPENLIALKAAVLSHQADCGLAFDGDGDRLGLIDHRGQIIWPDRLLMLFAQKILLKNPGVPIIFDVKCSRHLHTWISRFSGIPCMWKTGHSLIKAKMKEIKAPLAGEMSGHFFFKSCYGFDDALYAGAYLLSILSEALCSKMLINNIGDLFKTIPNSVSTPEIMIGISEQKKFNIMQQLITKATLKKSIFKNSKISIIDGLRIDFKDGFGLIRCSNTSPNLICRFEGDNVNILLRIQNDFRKLLDQVNPRLDLAIPF